VIDTVQLLRRVPNEVAKKAIRDFIMIGRGRFVFNPAPTGYGSLPRVNVSFAPDGSAWLSTEVSMPMMLFNSNALMVTQKDIDRALDGWSIFVSEVMRFNFNAGTAPVARVDFCFNFSVDDAYLYLQLVGRADLPRLDRWSYENTIYFGSQQRKRRGKRARSRLIRCYEKLSSSSATNNFFRLESCYCTSQACERLARKFGLGTRSAVNLLREEIAVSVLNHDLELLGLTHQSASFDSRIDRLRAKLGDTRKCRSLVAFMCYLDRYGPKFYERGIGAYSRPAYYRYSQQLKATGVWLSKDAHQSLPPLRVVPSSDQCAQAA
jgi:hypothetical protein